MKGRTMDILSIEEYRELVRASPPPDATQMEAFAEYVSSAHSWYKHLPLVEPRFDFVFHIDPCAMMADRPPCWGDRWRFAPYTRQERLLHYSTMPTEEYRARFGRLAYSLGGRDLAIGVPVATISADGMVEARLRGVPREIAERCAVKVTAVVHPSAACWWVWARALRSGVDGSKWPIESGGRERFEEITAYCRESLRPDPHGPDPGLTELLRPERNRQLRAMVAGMQRLRELLWP